MAKEGQGESDLYETWVSFSKMMGIRLDEMGKEGSGQYQEVLNSWSEFNKRMNVEMLRYLKDEERARRALEIMSRHSKAIEGTINSCISGNGAACTEDINESWASYSENVGKMLMEIIDANMSEQRELYELWMDSYGLGPKEGSGASAGAEGPQAAASTPFAMWSTFQRALEAASRGTGAMPGQVPSFDSLRKIQDEWTKEYSAMLRDAMRSPAFAAWTGSLVGTAMDGKMRMDKLTEQYIRSLGLPTRGDIDGLRERFLDLQRQLADRQTCGSGARDRTAGETEGR